MGFTKESATEAGKKSSRAGVPNKSTTELKDMFRGLLEMNMDSLQSDLDKMKPETRVDALLKIASFVLPKVKAIDMNLNDIPVVWNETKIYDKPKDWVQSKKWI